MVYISLTPPLAASDSHTVSPPLDVGMVSYIMAQLHCKLNCTDLMLRLLKAADEQYTGVNLKSLREAFDDSTTLLKRVNLGRTKLERDLEQEQCGHGMHR